MFRTFNRVYLLADSKMVTGTTKLMEDGTTVLIAVAAASTTAVVGYHLFKKQHVSEEGEAKAIDKKIRSTLIAGVGIILVSAIVKVIFSYYGG